MAATPDSLRDIAEVVGMQDALVLAERARHRNLYVPKTMTSDHWIVGAIGPDKANALVRYYGGCKLDIASGYAIKVADRRRSIQQDHKEGATKAELMGKYKMSARGIDYALAGKTRPRTAHDGKPRSHKRKRASSSDNQASTGE